MIYPIKNIREDFPILKQKVNNYPLIYLDSAASAQRPKYVFEREIQYASEQHSAVHRGIHTLSKNATKYMEDIRSKIAYFLNAKSETEIIFVKGATEGINLVAYSWGENYINTGDNIVITQMEHHANIVPWQILARKNKIEIRYIPLLFNGRLDIDQLKNIINHKTRLLCITHMSNVLGTFNEVETIIKKIKKLYKITVLIDGAQAIVHHDVDVQKINCDFYVFSGHKLYGPPGIGVLYGKKEILDSMPPWEGGGGMIQNVCLNSGVTFNSVPWKFEAGSPNISGIIGLGAAIDYINQIGKAHIHIHENQIINYALLKLKSIPKIKIYGSEPFSGLISFNLENHHAYDIGLILNEYGIAIRTGHHCAMPIMKFFKIDSMCRISIAMYTNKSDIRYFIKKLIKTINFLEKIN
ncbi:MAG: cysteine desulfurase [Wigglesworthia glossinidia]|nr:cysteine desulfurase [Wigglesworthia glossinidia]